MKIKLTASYGKEGFKVQMWTGDTWHMDLENCLEPERLLG